MSRRSLDFSCPINHSPPINQSWKINKQSLSFSADLRVNIFSDLIIDSYLIRVTISHEVEVMDWTGPVRFVEEGKSVSRPAVRQTEEEQHRGQPEREKLGKFSRNSGPLRPFLEDGNIIDQPSSLYRINYRKCCFHFC